MYSLMVHHTILKTVHKIGHTTIQRNIQTDSITLHLFPLPFDVGNSKPIPT